MDIPIILLSLIEKKYSIIHDLNDIVHLIPPSTSLEDYNYYIDEQKIYDLMVQNICNYWIKIKYKLQNQYIPKDVCNLIIKLMPKFNVRPIGANYRRNLIQLSNYRRNMDKKR